MRRRRSGSVAATVLVAALALMACSSGGGAGAGNAGEPDGASTDAGAAAPDCDPPRPAVATDAAQSFRFGDQTRACRAPYRFAAVAMVAAFIPTTCPVDQATPSVIAFHGTADPAVPYDGGSVGGGPAGIPPVLQTLEQYADAYGCDRPPTEDEPAAGVETDTLTGCVGGSEVVLYTIVGGTHDWPGNAVQPAASGGQAYAATDAILDFFDAHARAADTGGDGT
jgi:polyhydroxybutyrate depolymerase